MTEVDLTIQTHKNCSTIDISCACPILLTSLLPTTYFLFKFMSFNTNKGSYIILAWSMTTHNFTYYLVTLILRHQDVLFYDCPFSQMFKVDQVHSFPGPSLLCLLLWMSSPSPVWLSCGMPRATAPWHLAFGLIQRLLDNVSPVPLSTGTYEKRWNQPKRTGSTCHWIKRRQRKIMMWLGNIGAKKNTPSSSVVHVRTSTLSYLILDDSMDEQITEYLIGFLTIGRWVQFPCFSW